MHFARIARLTLLWAWLLPPVLPAQPPDGGVVLEPDADGVQRGAVVLDSYEYRPAHLIVTVGVPVELTLTSDTFLIPHNFILDAPEAGLAVSQEVSAGETVTVRFTATRVGTYPFYCDKQLLFFPSHREEGMEGRLEVRE